MKHAKKLIVLLLIVVAWVWHRMPIITGPLTKQTIYVAVIDAMGSGGSDACSDPQPPNLGGLWGLWIDDDSGPGISKVMRLCDTLNIRATLAVVPDNVPPQLIDSLADWQRRGGGIALHGLHHDSWEGWTEEQVTADLRQSREALARMGLDTARLMPIVVPPHARNTRAIRAAIRRAGCHMVTGANVVNPSPSCQLWGRLWITRDTDLDKVRHLLERAREKQAFVVLGTHSSQPNEFSYEKTKAVIGMAFDMGFASP